MKKAAFIFGLLLFPLLTHAQTTPDCGIADETDAPQLCFAEQLFPNCQPAKITFLDQKHPYSIIIEGVRENQCWMTMEMKNSTTGEIGSLTCPHTLESVRLSEETEQVMDKVARVELAGLPYALVLSDPEKGKEKGCYGTLFEMAKSMMEQGEPETPPSSPKSSPPPQNKNLPSTGGRNIFFQIWDWLINLF